ncbi:hypothetical protein Aduo_001034 [Ancylostoma duodenale]
MATRLTAHIARFRFDDVTRLPKEDDYCYFVRNSRFSEHRQNYGKGDYDFFDVFGQKNISKKYIAAAEIIITEDDEDINEKITHIITASGSVRTVEAVSSVALRMLLFGESVHDAVKAPSAFYDIRTGNFFCDNKVHIKDLYEKYKLKCSAIDRSDFEANDRVVMAAHYMKGENELTGIVHAAMNTLNPETSDVNNPVGY